MDSMDLKGIAWVGNIYQKFEAMCMEVEEAMCQETAKYVENQVQTVGASMKRFCSDVMQDMLPPSSKDLSTVASADLLLNPYLEFGIHKKPISNIKKDVIDPVKIKSLSATKSNSSNDVWEDWSFNWEISDEDEVNRDQMAIQASNKAIECGSRGEMEGQISNLIVDTSVTKSSAEVGKRSRCISSRNITRAERTTETCESSGLVSQMGLQEATSNTLSCQSIIGNVSHADPCENTQCGESVGDAVFQSHAAECDPDLEGESDDTIGRQSETEFEETCVLVVENDYHHDNHIEEEIRRSYKKKIQNVLSLKKKPTSRKQEYKQLAAQYANFNAEPDIQIKGAVKSVDCELSKNIKSKKLATRDSLDTEWELL